MTRTRKPLRAYHALAALSEWHPWVLAITIGCLISGLRGFTSEPDPRLTIDQYIMEPYRAVYYLALSIGGLVMLLSIAFRGLRDRLMLEQVGLWAVSSTLFIYQVAILVKYGEPFGVSSSVILLIAIGGFGRIGRILWELHLLNRIP